MIMLLPALLLGSANVPTEQAAPAPPPVARASTTAIVRILRAAEIREGRSDSPHQRRIVSDPSGRRQILLEFE